MEERRKFLTLFIVLQSAAAVLYLCSFLVPEGAPRIIYLTAVTAVAVPLLFLFVRNYTRGWSSESRDSQVTGVTLLEGPEEEDDTAAVEAVKDIEKQNKNRREFMNSLSSDIRDKSKVIPVLINQIEAVISNTDEAAMTLSKSFMNINKLAKEQVSEVTGVFGILSENGNTEENLLTSMKSVLQEILESFSEVMSFIRQNKANATKIIEDTEAVSNIVSKIDGITEDSKVLAINAAIEAARAGENGKGFAVVASEFRKLSENSEAANREIQDIIDSVSEKTKLIAKETEDSYTRGSEVMEQAKEMLETSLSRIDTTISETKTRLQFLSEQAADLAKQVSAIVVSIQFQDITRQRLEHVMEPLEEFKNELETISGKILDDSLSAYKSIKNHAVWLEQKYTMEHEKEILRSALETPEEEEI